MFKKPACPGDGTILYDVAETAALYISLYLLQSVNICMLNNILSIYGYQLLYAEPWQYPIKQYISELSEHKGNKIEFVNENVFSIPSYLDMTFSKMGPEKSPVFVLIR